MTVLTREFRRVWQCPGVDYDLMPPASELSRDILRHNRQTYDELADEYAKRVPADLIRDLPLVLRVWTHLVERSGPRPRVIDLGCGHGVNLALFERLGAATTGIDFSSKMLAVARHTSPHSELIEGEFLATTCLTAYDLVFAKAFLHLFPERLCPGVLSKVRSILAPRGLAYVATTVVDKSAEGFFAKSDYPGTPLRFRRLWRTEDLITVLENNGFDVIEMWTNDENEREKRWANVLMRATHAG